MSPSLPLTLLILILPIVGGCFHASITSVATNEIHTDENTALIPKADDQILLDQGCGEAQVGSAQLREQWGPPTTIQAIKDGGEVWHYRRGLRWAGFSIFIAVGIIPIPLPLVLPIGSREYDFTVVNGEIQHVRILHSEYGHSAGVHAGFTFDESGNTLNSAWIGRHPFWGGHEFLEAFGGHLSSQICALRPTKRSNQHTMQTDLAIEYL
ncbi:hypothetical protein AYO43_09310 [Nitrospira sp. SCGC AG-212-E16]|nr:hypothetical protein AYO43_09310 [Nitrospira sp. SCGC AG-212-E16]